MRDAFWFSVLRMLHIVGRRVALHSICSDKPSKLSALPFADIALALVRRIRSPEWRYRAMRCVEELLIIYPLRRRS